VVTARDRHIAGWQGQTGNIAGTARLPPPQAGERRPASAAQRHGQGLPSPPAVAEKRRRRLFRH